jgi:hypothetical protein
MQTTELKNPAKAGLIKLKLYLFSEAILEGRDPVKDGLARA